MQQSTRDGDALTLAAGEIRRIDWHIKPCRLFAHEIIDMRESQCVMQLLIGSLRIRHDQIVTQRPHEQMAARTDEGNGSHQCGFGQTGHFDGFAIHFEGQ